jgi:hypothetical protein
MIKVACDIETNGLYNEVDTIHCIVIKDLEKGTVHTYDNILGEHEVNSIREGVLHLLGADQIVGHNFIDYDMRVIEKITGVKLDVNKIVDTLLISHMLHPHHTRHPDCPASKETIAGRRQIGRHSLENWGYYLGEGKIEYEDWSKYTPEMLERCKGDVSITEKLYKRFIGE